MKYRFNEDVILKDIKDYIDDTYSQHYANGKYQATDVIIDSGHGESFCIGNMLKYIMRYKKKGDEKDSEKDLLKVIHYAVISLYINRKQREDNE